MFNGVEISNKEVEGETLGIVITFDNDKAALQILAYSEHNGYTETEIFDEAVFDDDEDELCYYLQDKLLELSQNKEDILKNINTVKIQSNRLFDIKQVVNSFNFCVFNKYSNILQKRIHNLGYITNDDKKLLKSKGYYFW